MTRLVPPTESAPRRRNRSRAERDRITAVYAYSRKTPEGAAVLMERTGLTVWQLYNAGSRDGGTQRDPFELTFDPQARWKLRDDPNHTVFTPAEDAYLRRVWPAEGNSKSLRIEAIAMFLDKTETAVAYHARQLERLDGDGNPTGERLRNVAQFYDAERVRAWLDLRHPTAKRPNEPDELALLDKFSYGLLHPCTDLDGRIVCTLVSTAALARLLFEAEEPISDTDDGPTRLRKQFMRKLLDERWPDEFFVKEITEGVRAIAAGEQAWEPSPWISHGRTDLHPISAGRGLFLFDTHNTPTDDDTPFSLTGLDFLHGTLRPQDLHPDERVDADEWRHPFVGRENYTLGRDPAEALGLSLADLRELAA